MNWPIYFAQNLTIGSPTSDVGLCLLWTPQERVLPELSPQTYAVAGNLYSRDGISFLVRNILARPTIRTIVICGKDITGSGSALVTFMQHGVDEHHCVVGDGARLHPELSRETIDLFRRSIHLVDARDTVRPEAIAALLANLPHYTEPFLAAPLVFPYHEPTTETLPAEMSGFIIRAPTIRKAYLKLLWHIMTFGQRSETQHSSDQREVLALMTIVSDEPTDLAHSSYADWMPFSRESVGQRQPDGLFSGYLEQFLQAGSTDTGVSYTYGDRLRAFASDGSKENKSSIDQVEAIIADLRLSGHSRRAIATLWDPHHDPQSPNPPCLCLVQSRLRSGQLQLTAYFRSHDMYRAWALNAFGLHALQGLIAEALSVDKPVQVGDLAIISLSAHIYAHDWEAARDILAHHHRATDPRLVRDPRGSFVITLEPPYIVVRHYTPDGDHLRTIRGENARELGPQLTPYISELNHAIYLGQELQKAEFALRLGRVELYKQDREFAMQNEAVSDNM